ncbi:MAG: chromosome partitioning protein ParB, partial [Anaeromyxobacteraceae bacterium]
DDAFRLRGDGDVALLATSLGRLGQLSPVELRPWPGAASDGPRWQVVAGFRRLAAVRLLARERVLARLHGELSDQDAWGLALGDALLREPLSGPELEALRERLRASGAAPWADELVDEALVRAPVAAEERERFFAFLTGAPSVRPEPFDSGRGDAAACAQDRLREAESKDETPPSTSTPTADEIPSVPPERSEAESKDEAALPTAPAEEEALLEVTPEELAEDLAARLSAITQDLAVAFEAWSELPREGRRAIVEQARYIAELMPFLEEER